MGEMKGCSYLGEGSAGVGHIRVELAPQPLTTGCPDLVQELPIRPVTDSQVGRTIAQHRSVVTSIKSRGFFNERFHLLIYLRP